LRVILVILVVSQFFCTSLWFAGNAVISEIARDLHLDQHFLAHLTSAIQFGFITGSLVFAVFTISDRFSPSLVFFFSSILAALFNLGISINGIQPSEILLFRFLTGFFLAGIYPVGMKIASDHYQAGLGKSLGLLVGALVVGTAFPHLLKNPIVGFPWKYALYVTSILSVTGGLCVLLFIPNGPHRRSGQKIRLSAFLKGFRKKDFRAISLGYFGHMWELYTFWAFVPVMLSSYNDRYPETNLNVSLLSFIIIGCGALACVLSGALSQYYGVKKVAWLCLLSSCICCLASPLFLFSSSVIVFTGFLFIWGLVVIADSPLFSTLVAHSADDESRGTSLTIVTCIGFSITIISIQLLSFLSGKINAQYIYTLLAIGPIIGLIALFRNNKTTAHAGAVPVTFVLVQILWQLQVP
jgi:MFS family permease